MENLDRIWTDLDGFWMKKLTVYKKRFFRKVKWQYYGKILDCTNDFFELSESLNVLSDNNFHLKNCMNIQFH